MKRNVLFFVDVIDSEGYHIERYLSFGQQDGEIHITTEFFDEILRYFNYGCHNCLEKGDVAVDVTRIIDNGRQIYFDHEDDVEEIHNGRSYRD